MKLFNNMTLLLHKTHYQLGVWRRRLSGKPPVALQLFRPELSHVPAPMRRYAEAIVAIAALMALLMSLGIGAWAFVALMLSMAMIYAILTHVFGLELGLQLPT